MWKTHSVTGRLPLSLAIVVLTIVLLLAVSSSVHHHDNVIGIPASSGRHDNVFGAPASSGHHSNCSAVFEQGAAWVHWRNYGPDIQPLPGAPVCVIQKFTQERVQACLGRRFRSQRRPFDAYFIGDSRIRELYSFSSPRLGADTEIHRGKDNCLERVNRTYEPGEQHHGHDHWCSYARWGPLVNTTYLIRHHLDQRYLDSLRTLLDRCERGECADLVIVNGGLHEMWRNYGKHWAVGVQRLGRQVAQLAPLLARLAQRGVIVIWPLIEPPMEDAGGGFVRMTPELAWLLNQVVVTELGRVPGVHLWSSHIAVTLWYQNLCRMLQFPKEGEFSCADPLHAGGIAQENYFDILMNYLCDGFVAMPDSGCCGLVPRTDL